MGEKMSDSIIERHELTVRSRKILAAKPIQKDHKEFFLDFVHEATKRDKKIKNLQLTIVLIVSLAVLFLFIAVAVSRIIYANHRNLSENLNSKMSENDKLNIQINHLQEVIKLYESINKWNVEVNKKLNELVFSDFLDEVISSTPEEYRDTFIQKSKENNVPASLVSAQAWEETRFKTNLSSFDRNIIKSWKQVWNKKKKVYDIYGLFKKTGKWAIYKGEVSVGMAQINLNSQGHNKLTAQEAFGTDFAIDFMAKRWRYFLDYYKGNSVLFYAMAYNNPGAAKNGKYYLEHNRDGVSFLASGKSVQDMKNARFIIRYGEDVVSIARNEKLIRIYNELFADYKKYYNSLNNYEKEFLANIETPEIPPLKLLYVNQGDYRLYVPE